MKKLFKPTFERRNALAGRLFCMPFYIGFAFFFFAPLVQSLIFSFGKVETQLGGFNITPVGFANFYSVFRIDMTYTDNLLASITGILYQVPVIIITSLLFSIVLNQKFLGRTLTRAIFFIPVIVASGVVINVMMGDKIAISLIGGAVPSGSEQNIFNSTSLQNMLINSGLNASFVNYFTSISNNLFDLLWRTGIQTIMFLAGLQTISPSLYEASSIEGATAWENFWMITFPMLIPIMIVNIVYTIVDSFTNPANKIMVQIINQFNNLKYGEASAMAWTHFLLIAVVLAVVFLISSRGDREIKNTKKGRSYL